MPVVNEKCDITELLICLVIKVMIHYLCFGNCDYNLLILFVLVTF